MAGKIEVVTGPMFSGKTTELLHRLEKYFLAGKSYCAFKPDKDTRQQSTSIRTIRDVITVNYKTVHTLDHTVDTDIIVLDEAQFFGQELISFCQSAKDEGKVVLVCGLDMDYNRKPFGYMGELMAIADSVTKLTAICACGKDAQYTKKIGGDKTRQVEIGDQCYIPCCADCYSNRTKKKVLRSEWKCPQCGVKNYDDIAAIGKYVPICKNCCAGFKIYLEEANEFDEQTANQVSNWLNENGYEDASLAVDCEFDL